MFDFHQNKAKYFDIQNWVTSAYIIPFISSEIDLSSAKKILEIGCAEAGVLKAFLNQGHRCTGIELSESRVETAKKFLDTEIKEGRAEIINKNIYDVNVEKEMDFKFDIIILKDVIEHIPNQEKFIPLLKSFLTENGIVFFAYPPWWMPFGGHQQICSSKILGKLPWFHLLPQSIYLSILKLFKEPKGTISELLDIKSTGITIDRLYAILKKNNYTILKENYWLINPIYIKKFNFKPLSLNLKIPYLRNFFITAHYIVFK